MTWGQQIITALVGGGLVLLGFAIAALVLGRRP